MVNRINWCWSVWWHQYKYFVLSYSMDVVSTVSYQPTEDVLLVSLQTKISAAPTKLQCENDIITLETNSLSWAKLWEFSKWQCDVFDEVIIIKLLYSMRLLCWLGFWKSNTSSNYTTINNGRHLRSPAYPGIPKWRSYVRLSVKVTW